MKKNLLNSFAVLVLALGSPAGAYADNVVYGLVSSWDGAKTASFDLSSVNSSSETTVNTEFSFDNISEIKCGAAVGNKYYAFVNLMDEDYNETYALVSINFTTGKLTTINDFSYGYGKPGFNASSMTYDKSTESVYVSEISFDDNDNYITTLYILDPATGNMSKVTSWSTQYNAIASDNNGSLYLIQNKTDDNWKNHPNLYKASGDTFDNVAAIVENGVETSVAYTNSLMTSEDGKSVYYIANTGVVKYDVDAKTASVLGTLSKPVAGATYDKSTEDGTPAEKPAEPVKNTRMLVESDTYGSSMGDIPTTEVSNRYFYYYNVDGKLVGSAKTARGYGEESNKFSATDVTKYVFDENGNTTNEDAYQWGWYDFDDYAWKKTKNCVSYTYNEDGKVASKTEGVKYFTYTYNEDGTLKESNEFTSPSATTPIHTITYSNYDENGNALHYVSDGAYDSYKYQADITYDENGNKVDEFRYTVKESEDPEYPVYAGQQHETWTYTDNILAQYEKNVFNGEDEVPSFKRVYTPFNGNTNVIDVNEYDYSADYDENGNVKVDDNNNAIGKWYNSGLPKREYYTDFADMKEATAVEIIASQADPDNINTTNLAFSVPQLAMTSMYDCKFVIYRDCLPIDTVGVFDIYDEDSQCCIYNDKNLKNGTYTYFVQPIFAPVSGDLLDAEEGDDAPVYTGYYSSNPVDVTVNTKLPAVDDLKLAGGKIETTGSFVNIKKTYYANLSWKNPEDASKYGFIKNSIYFVGAGVSEVDTTDVNADKATVMLYDEDAQAYVVTSYLYGKAISDTIDVKLKDIEALATGIGAVTVNDAVKVTFNGNTVSLGENANVAVFATSGQKVYEQQNTNNVNLGNLSAGTYIVAVEKNGKVNAYKYNVK